MELTIAQVKKSPAEFLYVFAADVFLNHIDAKSRNIIRGKKANQIKLLQLSAEKYGKAYQEYVDAIYAALQEQYGFTPAEILVKLANGEAVAGKNWSAGVYGVGANMDGFTQNPSVKVDPITGKILVNGVEAPASKMVSIAANNCPNNILGYVYTAEDGATYSSAYKKINKKYYASQYAKGDILQTPSGAASNASDSASIWESICLSLDKFVKWLLDLFGTGKQTINAANTAPSQSGDGFSSETTEASIGTIAAVGLLAVAAGMYLAAPDNGKKKKK